MGNSGTGKNQCVGAEAQMPRRARTAAHDDPIFENSGARQPAHTRDYAIATDTAVVAYLNKIVDLGAFTDDRIAECASIDCGVGAKLDAVLDDDTPQLGNLAMPICAQLESETFSPDDDAGLNDDFIAEMGAFDRNVGANDAVAADTGR